MGIVVGSILVQRHNKGTVQHHLGHLVMEMAVELISLQRHDDKDAAQHQPGMRYHGTVIT